MCESVRECGAACTTMGTYASFSPSAPHSVTSRRDTLFMFCLAMPVEGGGGGGMFGLQKVLEIVYMDHKESEREKKKRRS